MKTQSIRSLSGVAGLGMITALLALLSACTTMPEETDNMLTQAEQQVEQARQMPAVTQHAAGELEEAESSLQRAKTLWEEEGRDATEAIDHHAYLAQQQATTALQLAALEEAREEIAQASEERDQILLQAREQEIEAAEQRAEVAEQQAQAAGQQAQAARQEDTRESPEQQEQLQELQQTVESLQAQQTERGTVLTLDQVLFDFGEAELNPGGERALEQLAQFLEQNPDRQLLVEGFTDNIGEEDFNRELSQQRADAVREQLLAEGVSSDRINIQGHGESYPIASNETAAGRQLNRRVEVVLADQGQGTPEPRNASPNAEAQDAQQAAPEEEADSPEAENQNN